MRVGLFVLNGEPLPTHGWPLESSPIRGWDFNYWLEYRYLVIWEKDEP